MDGFGVMLAAVTAIGVSTIRDMILLGQPPSSGCATPYLGGHLPRRSSAMDGQTTPSYAWYVLPVADAFRLALAMRSVPRRPSDFPGTPGLIAVIMGTMTGAAGMIRDVLARRPYGAAKEIYATACILGGILYTLSLEVGVDRVAMLISMLGVFGLRVAAIYWHPLPLPTLLAAAQLEKPQSGRDPIPAGT